MEFIKLPTKSGYNTPPVVMLPWFAFGHLIPFQKLSIALAEAGIRVSFISTPKNIRRLPKVPPDLESLIELVEFNMPKVEGLPDGAEASVDIINMDEVQGLKIAHNLLMPQLREFVSINRTDWIIHDFGMHLVLGIAQEFGIKQIMFSVFSPSFHAFFGPLEYLIGEARKEHWPNWESLTSKPKWVTFPSLVAFRPYEAIDVFPGAFLPNTCQLTDNEHMCLTIGACEAVAIRGCNEFAGEYLDLAEKIYRKPVIPIGLCPAFSLPSSSSKHEGGEIFKWLDQHQKHKSVVYVGFGSEVKLSKEQVHEIAHGLELANLPFFWALRKPRWATDEEDALPLGFRSKTDHLGMVYMGWVPQLEILAHPSIGGSLFHSGWGSIIETLQHGHAIVVLPLVYDQGLNARLLVEKGLAVEVDRREDGKFDRFDVSKALRRAMVDEEGEKLRVKCNAMKALFGDEELNHNYMDGFVRYLRDNSNSKVQSNR